jgi:hypothetical protein
MQQVEPALFHKHDMTQFQELWKKLNALMAAMSDIFETG